VELIGLDDPLAQELLGRYKRVPAEAIGVAAQPDDTPAGVVLLWFVERHGKAAQRQCVQAMAVDRDGQRLPQVECGREGLPPGEGLRAVPHFERTSRNSEEGSGAHALPRPSTPGCRHRCREVFPGTNWLD